MAVFFDYIYLLDLIMTDLCDDFAGNLLVLL